MDALLIEGIKMFFAIISFSFFCFIISIIPLIFIGYKRTFEDAWFKFFMTICFLLFAFAFLLKGLENV
jgi:hypothetical protein